MMAKESPAQFAAAGVVTAERAFPAMTKHTLRFKDSQEAAFRRLVRDAIRKGPFTKGQRDVTLALVNHWFHHKSKNEPIHPGRKRLAKAAGVTEKTVSRSLDMLRACACLIPVSNLHGGFGTSTKYQVNIHALMVLCGCDWLDQFVRGFHQNVPVVFGEMSRLSRDKMSHGIRDVATVDSSNKRSGRNA